MAVDRRGCPLFISSVKYPKKIDRKSSATRNKRFGVVSGMLRGKQVSFISLTDFKTKTYTYNILSKNKKGYIYYICLLNV